MARIRNKRMPENRLKPNPTNNVGEALEVLEAMKEKEKDYAKNGTAIKEPIINGYRIHYTKR